MILQVTWSTDIYVSIFFSLKVENAGCPQDLENLQDDLSELLQAAGWDKVLTYANRVPAMQLVAAHEAFYKSFPLTSSAVGWMFLAC